MLYARPILNAWARKTSVYLYSAVSASVAFAFLYSVFSNKKADQWSAETMDLTSEHSM